MPRNVSRPISKSDDRSSSRRLPSPGPGMGLSPDSRLSEGRCGEREGCCGKRSFGCAQDDGKTTDGTKVAAQAPPPQPSPAAAGAGDDGDSPPGCAEEGDD